MAGTSTRTSVSPDFITSPIAADMLCAELDEHADAVERAAAESGESRITKARVRSIRRAARQVEALHAGGE